MSTSGKGRPNRVVFCLFLAIAALAIAPAAFAALPSGFTEFPVASGLSSPTAMAFAPDGRIFVCQQGGALRVIKNGALLPTPFLTVTVNSAGERGLLGVAFDPNFAGNQYVYVYYTASSSSSGSTHRVSRFTASGDVAVPGSEAVLLSIVDASSASNHNGGALHFSADGKLLIAVGERAQTSNSQTLSNLLGKVLRMNTDGSIPTDNPFYNSATGQNRLIWVYGLRNPFTVGVQPGTGRVFINDVGGGSWEEINDGIAGSNYGWPAREGMSNDPQYRSPVHAYPHVNGEPQCAITGGTFYNPDATQFPSEYVGRYFFADFCANWIRVLNPSTGTATSFATGISGNPVDLKVGPDGSLYYLARSGGVVRRIAYTAGTAPTVTSEPSDATVPQGDSATFRVTASGTAPLSYQWQRNMVDIPGATSSTYSFGAAAGDSGARFRCRISNSFGSVFSRAALLTVTANTRPSPTIATPTDGAMYSGGDTISFSGTATDPEDGTLGAGAFVWQVDFHHDTHTHPQMAPTSGITSGSFTVPTLGETSTNVWFRIHLTVTDSGGLTRSVFRDVRPRVSRVTLTTQPPGQPVSLDGGAAQPGPLAFDGVVGVMRTVGVPSSLSFGGGTWQFLSWSDGGAASHSIATPSSNTTLTATFRLTSPTPVPATRVAGDFNGNGMADIVWRNRNTGVNGYWYIEGDQYRGAAAFQAEPINGWDIAATGDFNGDQKMDLVWRHQASGANGIWYMDGTVRTHAAALPSMADRNWSIEAAADFDNDGRCDLLWRRASDGLLGIWYMDNTQQLRTAAISYEVGADWIVGGVGDFNADSRPDIVLRNVSTGIIGVWLMTNTVRTGVSVMDNPGLLWQISQVGDYDGDGDADLLWRNRSTGANGIWFMNGTTFVRAVGLPSAGSEWEIK